MRSLLVSWLLVAVAVVAPAQDRPRRVETDGVLLTGELVQVPVVVSDRTGHYVPGLGREDFRVFEDGVEQQIATFVPERVPFHVAILLDRSSSTRESIGDIQKAAVALVDQLGSEDRAMIVAFSDEAVVKGGKGFTSDKRVLTAAVRDTFSNGRTRLYDSVFAAVRECFVGVEGRKAMVILSDGQDTASAEVTFHEAVDAFRETDIVVYGVRYPDLHGYAPSTVTIYPKDGSLAGPLWNKQTGPRVIARAPDYDPFMEQVTRNSGGLLFYAEKVADMPALCEKIAEELRHVYTVGYQPTNAMRNGGHREIAVSVPSHPDAKVRYRLGYTP